MRHSLLLLLAFSGCKNNEIYEGAFDLPVAAAVLDSATGGPGQPNEPIGFVANGIGGRIVLLALKQGRYLNDDSTASFLRSNDLATGGLRRLTSVAPYAPADFDVTVFAGDSAFGQLVEMPWVVDSEKVGGKEVPVEGYTSYYPVDLSAAPGVTVTDIEIKHGYTTSERWTMTSDGREWSVEGSRSGRQPTLASPGEYFKAEERRIAFIVDSTGDAGDVFTIDTWNGLVEHDVGGAPLQLAMAPDQSALAMIVQDAVLDRPVLRWFDPATKRVMSDVALPADSKPVRMDFGEDGLLYVADAGLPAAWSIQVGSIGATEHPLPWPIADVAMLSVAGPPTVEEPDLVPLRPTLYVVPSSGRSLWLYDLDDEALIDVNDWVSGVQGLDFTTPVMGIGALRQPHLLSEFDDSARRESGRTVAVSLARGSVVFAKEETGCLAQDPLGPRSVGSQSGGQGAQLEYTTNFSDSATTGPFLAQAGASSRHVGVNPCGGIAVEDTWRLTYDQNALAWRVLSELRGDQVDLAYEDERYVSDLGEISFLIRTGVTPSVDGMQISFSIDSGTAESTGDNDNDGTRDLPFGVPSDPLPYAYEVGPRDGNWYRVDLRPQVLVLGTATNSASRVDPQDATMDAAWQ